MTLLQKLKARIPSTTPIGLRSFHLFCDEIFALYEIPNKPSYRQAVANMLIHRVPGHKVSMHQIACALKKAQTDEVCYAYVDQLIKEKKEKAESLKGVVSSQG